MKLVAINGTGHTKERIEMRDSINKHPYSTMGFLGLTVVSVAFGIQSNIQDGLFIFGFGLIGLASLLGGIDWGKNEYDR